MLFSLPTNTVARSHAPAECQAHFRFRSPSFAVLLALVLLAALMPSTASAAIVPVSCVTPYDGLSIRTNTTLCPGKYSLIDRGGDGVIRVVASGVTVGFSGVSISGDFTGNGVVVDGVSNVTLDGYSTGRVKGYRTAVLLQNGSGHTVRNMILSNNRKRPIFDSAADFLAVWPDWAGQLAADQIGNGIVLRQVTGATIANNTMRHQQNGIGLFRSDLNSITGNDCSDNQGWGIHLHRSSDNSVIGNTANNNHLEASPWCVAHQEAGCDTAAILVIKASNDNLVQNNSLRNSGDGVFAAAQESGTHWGADRNRYIGNDVSEAKHIGIESTFSDGNELRGNTIEDCGRFGIWLGYSTNATIESNSIIGNVQAGIANESTQNITVANNIIDANGAGIRLWRGSFPWVDRDSRQYTIHGNSVANNIGIGISMVDTHVLDIRQNTIADNSAANLWFGTDQESTIEGPITVNQNNILGLAQPYNVLTDCCETSCGVCDGEVGCCDSLPGCAYYFCSNQCHPEGTSNCDAGCTSSCTTGTKGRELGGPGASMGSIFGDGLEEILNAPPTRQPSRADTAKDGSSCRDHDGDVASCDATAGCAYYLCSDQCHATGTSNCQAGCTADCATECRDHDGDLASCDATSGCAYYLCSDQCHPVGTSDCDAGCSTACGGGSCGDYDGDMAGCDMASGCSYYLCSGECHATGTSNCDAGCTGDCPSGGGSYCGWESIVDLSENWWGTLDASTVATKICGDMRHLPIRWTPVP